MIHNARAISEPSHAPPPAVRLFPPCNVRRTCRAMFYHPSASVASIPRTPAVRLFPPWYNVTPLGDYHPCERLASIPRTPAVRLCLFVYCTSYVSRNVLSSQCERSEHPTYPGGPSLPLRVLYVVRVAQCFIILCHVSQSYWSPVVQCNTPYVCRPMITPQS
jgi:hypothetical protein